MRNKLNIAILTGIVLLGASAYATCYLNGVVLCFKAGDSVNSAYAFTQSPGPSYTTGVNANENAYRFDSYSVTRGGRHTDQTYTSYCDGVTHSVGHGPNTDVNDGSAGFQVYWYNPNVGSTVTGINDVTNGGEASQGIEYYSVTANWEDSGASSCN